MDSAPKQQIVERVKQANNILVTVSNNPSVDQLASCIGLTLMLNAMGKHATAVFSGKAPSTLEFLQPEKTLESNTDSLRDFIISLDKSKADKLRYKVEDQVVRIFITPYRTKISEADLIFSQGDFNVEVVIALGVKEREHIDNAITAHGRILHDATVVSLNAGEGGGNNDVGSLNWQEPAASSLCEMVVSVSEAFGSGLIDSQMATAFLTGIVAETERFSNTKTSPKVMTMSAQLMAAGANQQLIASKLSEEVVAPVRAIATGDENSQDQQVNDEIKIDHESKIDIDEHGNINLPPEPSEQSQPEPEEPPKPEEPKVEDKPQELPTEELSLPEPGLEYEAEIEKEHRQVLPNRLPVGDHQEPLEKDENSFAVDTPHKVIQPLPENNPPKLEEKLPNNESDLDEPESKISTSRIALDTNNDPALHSPFTANAQSPYEGNPIGALDSTHDPGILSHAKPSANIEKAEEPKPAPADKTLEDIEKELHNPDAIKPEDEARKAVEQVHNEAPYDEDRPKPVSALNANPVEFDQLHNPPEVTPGQPAAPPPVPEPFKMPELAITPPPPITNLPNQLEISQPEPVKDENSFAVNTPHKVIQPLNEKRPVINIEEEQPEPEGPKPEDIPAISVSPDGTLKVAGIEQPEKDTPPAPPPVPPPITPPSA